MMQSKRRPRPEAVPIASDLLTAEYFGERVARQRCPAKTQLIHNHLGTNR